MTDRVTPAERDGILHLQRAMLANMQTITSTTDARTRAEHVRRVLQAGGVTEPARLARTLERIASTLER